MKAIALFITFLFVSSFAWAHTSASSLNCTNDGKRALAIHAGVSLSNVSYEDGLAIGDGAAYMEVISYRVKEQNGATCFYKVDFYDWEECEGQGDSYQYDPKAITKICG